MSDIWIEAIVILLVALAAWRAGYKVGEKEGDRTGYTRGCDAGYERGRKEVDDWWIGVEDEADQARQKLRDSGGRAA